MSGSLAFVLGRPAGPRSVLPDVQARLRAAGVRVTVTTVADEDGLQRAAAADLRVLKDLDGAALERFDRSGLDCCNDAAATARSLDKALVAQVLRGSGVPVPDGVLVDDWREVRTAAAGGPVVVKPRWGSQGEGVLLLDGPAPGTPHCSGPWLVQARVRGDGLDRKLYVVGRSVDAVLRTWPVPADRRGRPVDADDALRSVALRSADALGLEVCGVDVVVTAGGPVVVDVNALPGFKGVPGAAARLSGHLLARLAREEVRACASSS